MSTMLYQSTLDAVDEEAVKFATHRVLLSVGLATFSASAFGNSDADNSSLTLSLLVPLVVIAGAAAAATWFLRRWKGSLGRRDGPLQLVHVIALGPRERIALVKVGARHLVVGITATNINMLTEVAGADVITPEPPP
jgi:flagellar biosynthetic protein FliO